MTSIPHKPPSEVTQEKRNWSLRPVAAEAWASMAITAMWVAVSVDALFGPDIVSTTVGGTSSTVPSAVVVALFAFLGTRVVARNGFGRQRND